MVRTAFAVLLASACWAAPLPAGEPLAKKMLGTWSRTKDDVTFRFQFAGDKVVFLSDSSLGKMELEGDYAVTKEGHVFGRIRKVREGVGPAAGELFGFTIQVKGEVLSISDWRGTGGAGLAQFLQGDYKKVSDK